MTLNDDFSKRVVLNSHTLTWLEAALLGSDCIYLERHAIPSDRATAIIRYEAGAEFAAHVFPMGQEILVLDGVYEDEIGSYEAGTYIKNLPGTSYRSSSQTGCTLFVKNNYLSIEDNAQRVIVDTQRADWFRGLVDGLTVLPLDETGTKHTALVRWAPETRFNPHKHFGGEEILVLEGIFEDEFGRYPTGTWIRSPHMSGHQPFSIEGCLILVKTGHLLDSPEAH
jgi:anti-sigma factor ChrR (cupin superfamily)